MNYSFWVDGLPSPGGSKKYVGHRNNRPVLVDMGGTKTKDWRDAVAQKARVSCSKALTGPLALEVKFYMPRPLGHYNKRGLKEGAAKHHVVRPDALKLMRSTEDAMTGIAYDDDSQIVREYMEKNYVLDDGKTGAMIHVRQLEDE